MPTIRRLYVYAMSGIALTVLGIGLSTLLGVAFHALGLAQTGAPAFRDPAEDRRQLSLAAAMIGVGLPVWLTHWWLAERGRRAGGDAWEPERGSIVRALYLTGVLGVALAIGAGAASELIRASVWQLTGVGPDYQPPTDAGAALSVLLVTGLAWAYHVRIRRADLAVGPLSGSAAWLPRAYWYVAALIGLGVGLQGLADLVALLGDVILPPASAVTGPLTGPDSAIRLGSAGADLAIGLAIWSTHAWYARRVATGAGWRGDSERRSHLRLGYFIAVIFGAAAASLNLAVQAVGTPLELALQIRDPSMTPITGDDALRVAAVALGSAVPWVVAWWLHVGWLRNETRAGGDQQRARTAGRLVDHTLALLGLAFAAGGSAWLLGLLLDIVLGGTRTATDLPWKRELAVYLPAAVLGTSLYVWKLRPIGRRYRADPGLEAASPVRRAALLFVLAGSVIAVLVSAALLLYRLFTAIFGVEEPGNTISILSTPLGILLAAVVLGLTHALLLRRDLRLGASHAGPGLSGLLVRPGTAPRPGLQTPGQPQVAARAASAPAASLLLDAMDAVAPLLASPDLRRRWLEPSALAEWTVAGVAGHLARAPRVVLDYLDAPPPESSETPVPGTAYYDAVLPSTFEADHPTHVGIRARGEEAASAGPDALAAWFAETRAALAGRLPSEPADRLLRVGGGVVIGLEDYLLTRLVEVTVHADDLAVSIGVPSPPFSEAISGAVIRFLVDVARRRHGDLATLRALTRRERDLAEALRIL
jgi:uncharacterized protein (TIGR03083 family)